MTASGCVPNACHLVASHPTGGPVWTWWPLMLSLLAMGTVSYFAAWRIPIDRRPRDGISAERLSAAARARGMSPEDVWSVHPGEDQPPV